MHENSPFRLYLAHKMIREVPTDPQTDVPPTKYVGSAICVRHVSVSGALQFAVLHAVSCVLHRPASRVIHCSELSSLFSYVGLATHFLLCQRNKSHYWDQGWPETDSKDRITLSPARVSLGGLEAQKEYQRDSFSLTHRMCGNKRQ